MAEQNIRGADGLAGTPRDKTSAFELEVCDVER